MNIPYKTNVYPPRPSDNDPKVMTKGSKSHVELAGVEFCCKKMEQKYKDHFEFAASGFDGRKNKLSFKLQYGDDDESMCSYTDYMEIDFCPFCGQKIEAVEKEMVIMERTAKTVTKTEYEFSEKPAGGGTANGQK